MASPRRSATKRQATAHALGRPYVALEVHDAATSGGGNRLGAAQHIELRKNALQMCLDGRFADEEAAADLLVALSLGQRAKHRHFALGEFGAADPLGQLGGKRSGHEGLARVDPADAVQDVITRRVFQQISLGPGLDAAVDVLLAIEGRKEDDAGSRVQLANLLDGAYAIQLGHAQVEQRDVRSVAFPLLDRIAPVLRFQAWGAGLLTRVAAMENAAHNVRINALAPGWTETPMVAANSAQNPTFAKLARAAIPAKRGGEANEVAAAAVWLCSDEASYIYGQMLVVDGGMTVGGFAFE
jgi:enoyl-ACP reductase-like protein